MKMREMKLRAELGNNAVNNVAIVFKCIYKMYKSDEMLIGAATNTITIVFKSKQQNLQN